MNFKVSLFHSIFQILYYNVDRGKKNTPLQIMNAAEIYDKYDTREQSHSLIGAKFVSVTIKRNDTEKHQQTMKLTEANLVALLHPVISVWISLHLQHLTTLIMTIKIQYPVLVAHTTLQLHYFKWNQINHSPSQRSQRYLWAKWT